MVVNHLRHRKNHQIQIEETGRRGGTVGCIHAAGESIGDNQRKVIPQERDAHARTNEARPHTLWVTRDSGQSSAWNNCKTITPCAVRTIRNEPAFEPVALLILVARSFAELVSIHFWFPTLCASQSTFSCGLLCQSAHILYLDGSPCALSIVSVVEMFCQICVLSRFNPRFSENYFASTEKQTNISAQNSRFIRAARRKLLECSRMHRRAVVRAQLRLWFSLGSGQWTFHECRSRMTLTRIGYGYFGSMCFDAREVWNHRARESRERRDERIARRSTLSVRKPVYRGHVIERERERLIAANRTLSSSAECGVHCSQTHCCNSLCRPCWKRACLVVNNHNSCSYVRCSCRVGRGKDVIGKKSGRIRGNGRSKMTCRKTTKIYFPKLIFKEWTPWLALAGSRATAETKET